MSGIPIRKFGLVVPASQLPTSEPKIYATLPLIPDIDLV